MDCKSILQGFESPSVLQIRNSRTLLVSEIGLQLPYLKNNLLFCYILFLNVTFLGWVAPNNLEEIILLRPTLQFLQEWFQYLPW